MYLELPIIIYIFYTGSVVAFYAGFFFKIIKRSLNPNDDDSTNSSKTS